MQTQRIGRFTIDRIVETEGPFAALDFLLPDVTPDVVERNRDWLVPRYIDPGDGRVVMSFHSFVIRTPYGIVFVDGCAGNDKERPLRPNWHRQNKPFLATLARAGVVPEQVDYVFCTHLHADHVGWNTRLENGRWVPTFPRARYLFARREYEFWERLHRAALAKGEAPVNHGSFADSVLPVMEAGRAVLVESDHEIVSDLRLEAAYGHTPGTCMLHAGRGAEHAVFLGDIVHTPVQLAKPSLSSRFCEDPAESASTRRAICERFAGTASVLLTGHFPAPTAGRIVEHRDGFRFAA